MSRIMYVEDDAILRDNISELLTLEGFDVEVHEDQNSVVASVESEAPNLVLLDVMLEDGLPHGYDLCRTLRDRYRDLPVVLFTSLDSPEDVEHGIAAGATAHLPKDTPLGQLVSTIRSLVSD